MIERGGEIDRKVERQLVSDKNVQIVRETDRERERIKLRKRIDHDDKNKTADLNGKQTAKESERIRKEIQVDKRFWILGDRKKQRRMRPNKQRDNKKKENQSNKRKSERKHERK